ncbi:hypothetical protein ACFPM0_14180 [Pseudonocardia sulfidoxydans]|uniref:hypothetical protein n=1 Tax=Pseudonocardia sulfidoxydans TaxID=54011 RepID=UPI00360969BF
MARGGLPRTLTPRATSVSFRGRITTVRLRAVVEVGVRVAACCSPRPARSC